jgi:hypothetical protein
MICEHGLDYQIVDDSGGDGGLDGFIQTSGDLHAFFCPEKPANARYRQKYQGDLEKACQLRDEKKYPIKRFVFITPEPLREPDQRTLRDLARDNGFDDGINISAEHLEPLFASHMEIQSQFPEISYPEIEPTLYRILNAVEEMQRTQSSASAARPTVKITDAPAQILILAVQAANKAIGGMAEAENIIRILDLTKDQYREAVGELHDLDLVDISKSFNAPGGYQGVRVRPNAFVQVATEVLPGVDTKAESMKLLQVFDSNRGEYVTADEILQRSSVPLARAQILIDYLEHHNFIETAGMSGQSDSLLFHYGRILPLGKRIVEGKDQLPI